MSEPKNGAVVRVEPQQLMPAAIVYDAGADMQQASKALRRLEGNGYEGDYTVLPQATVVCGGQTLLEAFEDATAFVRQSPNADVHHVQLAQLVGRREGEREYRLTLAVSYPDRDGETTGVTHQEPQGPRT